MLLSALSPRSSSYPATTQIPLTLYFSAYRAQATAPEEWPMRIECSSAFNSSSNEGQPNRLSALVGIWKISQRQRKLPFPPLVRLDRTFQPPVKVCRAHRGASHSREQHEFLRRQRRCCYSLRQSGGGLCVAPPGRHVCRLHVCFSLRRALPICDARCGDDDNSSNTTTRRIYNRREMRKVSRGVGIARMRAQKNEEKIRQKKRPLESTQLVYAREDEA